MDCHFHIPIRDADHILQVWPQFVAFIKSYLDEG